MSIEAFPGPLMFTAESACCAAKAQESLALPVNKTVDSQAAAPALPFLARGLRALAFERVEPGFQRLILLARGDRHRLDRLEFLAGNEVEPADPVARALLHRGLRLAGHAGDGAGGAVHHLDEIVEQFVLGLHACVLLRPS